MVVATAKKAEEAETPEDTGDDVSAEDTQSKTPRTKTPRTRRGEAETEDR